jgi:hypothetical protein
MDVKFHEKPFEMVLSWHCYPKLLCCENNLINMKGLCELGFKGSFHLSTQMMMVLKGCWHPSRAMFLFLRTLTSWSSLFCVRLGLCRWMWWKNVMERRGIWYNQCTLLMIDEALFLLVVGKWWLQEDNVYPHMVLVWCEMQKFNNKKIVNWFGWQVLHVQI